MSWKTEFPYYDGEFYCPEGWVDRSWHNDVCPHIEKRTDNVAILVWQNYEDEDMREFEYKYAFHIEVDGDCVFDYVTNDWIDVLELMQSVKME